MRLRLLLPVVALLALPPGAHAQATGGAPAPSGEGGAEYGAPIKPQKRPAKRRPLVASHFSIAPGKLVPGGTPATIAWRVDGSSRAVRVRVDLVRTGTRGAATSIKLGWKKTGARRSRAWALKPGVLPAGDYVARLHAVDRRGRTLRRTATASGRLPVTVEVAPTPPAPTPPAGAIGSGIFPIRGAFSWGGDDARFGAGRPGHIHQGQDLMAAEGTPVVSPRAGSVYWKAYQASGAGHYLVVRDAEGRDYVFMHLVAGSLLVGKGDAVAAGQQIAQVGDTGRSDGAHLHFEIWPGGWYAKDSKPIDPRPELEAWAAG